MLKLIYIPPALFKIRKKNFKKLFLSIIYDFYIIFKNFFFIRYSKTNSTSGYIEDALYSNAYVFTLPYNFCLFFSKILNIFFDGLFISIKFDKFRNPENTFIVLSKLSKKFKIKKIILDIRDTSNLLISDETLKGYDYVVKREKDNLINHKKYISTMLPCTLVKYKIVKNNEKIQWNKIGKSKPNLQYSYDVFFSGRATSPLRSELIDFFSNKNINFYYSNIKLNYRSYLDKIYNSAINLALSGHGEFTYRHLEILANCSFLMCEKSIRNIEFPIPLKEGKHFVTFDDPNDLIDKIKFYLKNHNLRTAISLNGRRLLEQHYSPQKHGEKVLKTIFNQN